MTEAEWLACENPRAALNFLNRRGGAARKKSGQRKLRLFACACLRRLWGYVTDARCRRVVETAERYADGRATGQELDADEAAARQADAGLTALGGMAKLETGAVYSSYHDVVGVVRVPEAAFTAAVSAAAAPRVVWFDDEDEDRQREELRAQAAVLRDVFGNPFSVALPDSAWLTPTVVSVAQAAYDERILPSGELEPARLAILADALEEAGCTSDVLDHLRSAGPHVRGCWAVDLLLGKE